MNTQLDILTAKKAELDTHRPLLPEQVANVQAWLDLEYTYTSNAIEGNTLNRAETALIIEKGITVQGKLLREHLEAVNHARAVRLIHSLMGKGHQELSEDDIKRLHKIVLTGINDEWAGLYRRINVFIVGADVEPPPPNAIPDRMAELIAWLDRQQETHPAQIAADLHFKFVEIHPFIDGNGRSARLLMNLTLLQHGYPLAIIKMSERLAYMMAINEGTVSGNLEPFREIIYTAIERTLDAWLTAVNGGSILPAFLDDK